MKETFRDNLRLGRDNKERLSVINSIIEEYAKQGYVLTLRQLYYQLVSRGVIPNEVQEYAKLSSILVKGRMAGIVDWEAIEDRIRVPFLPYWVLGVSDAIDDTIEQYRLDRMKDQDVYIELWVEKDALSGVLKRITSHYHVNLMVNRGYSSCSAMHDAYKRFKREIAFDKNIVILYLGDHDPSGLDMIRDIEERIAEFLDNGIFKGVQRGEKVFTIKHIGLTTDQVRKFNPPPNPAKITDPRANWYIENYGNTSWEVDALTPEVLHDLVRKNIEKLIDMDKFNARIRQEEKDKKKLEDFKDKDKK